MGWPWWDGADGAAAGHGFVAATVTTLNPADNAAPTEVVLRAGQHVHGLRSAASRSGFLRINPENPILLPATILRGW